jgi:hypothetical protein
MTMILILILFGYVFCDTILYFEGLICKSGYHGSFLVYLGLLWWQTSSCIDFILIFFLNLFKLLFLSEALSLVVGYVALVLLEGM